MGRDRVRARRRRQLRHEVRASAKRKADGNGAQHVSTTDLRSTFLTNLALVADPIVGGASGGSYPLSDRGRAWDADAAEARVRMWASSDGSGDKDTIDWGKYGSAHFWKDDSPSELGDFKLGFADIVDGSPVAVWRGVTAAAGSVQGARGGVSIPSGDVSGVQSKIAGYYGKARTKYDDPGIDVPWKEAAATADDVAVALARAETEDVTGPGFAGRWNYWTHLFGPAAPEPAYVLPEAAHPLLAELVAKLALTRRDRTVAALTAAGETISPGVQSVYDLAKGTLAERAFMQAANDSALYELSGSEWPCESPLGEHGSPLYRDDSNYVSTLPNGALVWVRAGHGWCSVQVAAADRVSASETVAEFQGLYPALYLEANVGVVPVTFWSLGRFGPTSRMRLIEAQPYADIARNYAGDVRAELDRLVSPDFQPGKDGQLLLWQGTPGTGKTWALRALASEWAPWAEFHYITDPDSFFVTDPSYMIDVLLHESSYEAIEPASGDTITTPAEGKWRVLLLEDTGELLSANAREKQGQGLSRLLNVVDGMVGQGLRVLAFVTTNDELGELHPAVVRPGRCASKLAFGPLSAEEASAWVAETQGLDPAGVDVDGPRTLAELYHEYGAGIPAFAQGECADCGHMEWQHADGGQCGVQDCTCGSYDAAEAEAEVEVVAAADLQPALAPRDERPPLQPGPSVPVTEARAGNALAWTSTLLPEGRLTSDNRAIAPGATRWRTLPLSLMALLETGPGGHEGAQLAGRIDNIWRAAPLVRGEGEFDGGDFGRDVARLVGEGTLRGVSVDLAIHEYEVVPRSVFFTPDGNLVEDWADLLANPPEASEPGDGILDQILAEDGEEYVFLVTDCELGMATVCPFPAFADAEIQLSASGTRMTVTVQGAFEVVEKTPPPQPPQALVATAAEAATVPAPEVESGPVVTASAAGLVPVTPPAEWFTDPELTELTALVVDDDGRVYGHAAPWETCHIGLPGGCTVAPHSKTGYAMFHLGEIQVDTGITPDVDPPLWEVTLMKRVACGQITLDTGHADRRLNASQAAAHYDHTGTAVADVICGEDEFGIWVAGALRHDVDSGKARVLRGAKLSGDWRSIDGNLELVGLLAVNVPGFPVPRKRALVAALEDGSGLEVLSLVAAGINPLTPRETPPPVLVGEVAAEDEEALADLAARATLLPAPERPARPELVAAIGALDDAHARTVLGRMLLPASERPALDAAHDRTVAQITEILASADGTETAAQRSAIVTSAFEALTAAATREQPPAHVDVTVQPSPAPHVTVEAPPPAEVSVHVDAPPPAEVNVEVHPSPPPNVEVTVEPAPPAPTVAMRNVPIRDDNGRITEVRQEPIE